MSDQDREGQEQPLVYPLFCFFVPLQTSKNDPQLTPCGDK